MREKRAALQDEPRRADCTLEDETWCEKKELRLKTSHGVQNAEKYSETSQYARKECIYTELRGSFKKRGA